MLLLLLLLLALKTAKQTAEIVFHLLLSGRRLLRSNFHVKRIVGPEEQRVVRRQVVRKVRMMMSTYSSVGHHTSGHCGSRSGGMIKRILLQRMLAGLELGHCRHSGRRGHGVLMELGLDAKVVAEDLRNGEFQVARGRRCCRRSRR